MKNKKAQSGPDDILKIVGVFFSIIIGIAILGAVFNILSNIGCENEKAQIQNLKNDLALCQSQIQNQTTLTQNLNAQCDDRINESIITCNEDLTNNILVVNEYRTFFLIYHISIILSLVFGISLFKIVFRWKIHTHNKKLRIFLKSIKICWIGLWIILGLFFIGLFLYTLTFLFFPNWYI